MDFHVLRLIGAQQIEGQPLRLLSVQPAIVVTRGSRLSSWELHTREPVIDFRMLANRNFAIPSILFFVFGVGLFGTTVLIPQLLQSLYGYRAIDAGLVLGPGALVITLLAPVSAQLVQRRLVSPRVMIALSLTVIGGALMYLSSFNLDTDNRHYVVARVIQGIGYGFFFVPANLIAYSMLRPDQNNKASSLTNLFRNWGGVLVSLSSRP